ncbi:MAG: TetR/AcrR family transcriptional regulator [Myxococcota bacterium]
MATADPSNPLESMVESKGSPSPALSRRERRKLEMHARIVLAARDLFEEQGFGETRVADICERADIAQKTFFNHFPTKLDVLREIAHSGIEELMFDIEDIRKAELSTAQRIHRFFDTVGSHISDAGPRNRELLVELVHLISGDAAERSEQARRLLAAMQGIVEDGLVLGDVTRRHDPQALTEMILGAYYVLVFNYANLDDFPIRERGQAAARILADALAPHPEETHGTT